MGVDPATAAEHLANWLPQVINQVTPAGQVPDAQGLADTAKSLLGKFL